MSPTEARSVSTTSLMSMTAGLAPVGIATSDGRLAYALKRPWRDGTKGFLFSPSELLEKLVALTPP